MNRDRIEAIARDPARTRDELEQMKANALAKGDVEAAKVINDVLLERFPVRTKSGGGKTHTEAAFRRRSERFDSGKEAYLWLVERFCGHCDNVLDRYIEFVRPLGGRGSRFAPSADGLFPHGSKRTGNPMYFERLTNGWFADTNINHDDKFAALLKLSYVCGLRYPDDWEFRPMGSTEVLRKHQEGVVRAREILAALRKKHEVFSRHRKETEQ